MNKLLTLANIGLSGLNTDIAAWDLPPEFMNYGRNFRIANNAVVSSGGWSLLRNTGNPADGIQRGINVRSFPQDMYFLAGNLGLYSYDGTAGSVLFDVPAVEGDLWTFTTMGGIPIANHPSVGILYWFPVRNVTTPGDTVVNYLPYTHDKSVLWDLPNKRTGKVIRSHKTYLFLLNLTEEVNGLTQEMPDSFRWSHPAAANSIPVTWDDEGPDSQYFLAGRGSLGSNSGDIIDGLSLRNSFVIYSENAINLLEESQNEFVFNRRELTSYTGLLNKDCVCEVKGNHFFMSTDDILRFDGNSLESVMHKRIRNDYISNLSPGSFKKSFAVNNIANKEIWFCVKPVVPGGDEVSLAYVYNWKDDAWSTRDLTPNTVFCFYGMKSKSEAKTWADLQVAPAPLWESYNVPWGSDKRTPFDDTVLSITTLSDLFDVNIGKGAVADIPSSANKLTTGMALGRTNFPMGDQRGVTTITRVYLHTKGSGILKIRFGSQQFANGPINWKPEMDFLIGSQRKLDIRTTGELHCWSFSLPGEGHCELSGMDIEYSEAGLR